MMNISSASQEKSTANIGKKFNNSRESHKKYTAKIMEKLETGRAGYLNYYLYSALKMGSTLQTFDCLKRGISTWVYRNFESLGL